MALEVLVSPEGKKVCVNKNAIARSVSWIYYKSYCLRCDGYGNVSNPSDFRAIAVCRKYKSIKEGDK